MVVAPERTSSLGVESNDVVGRDGQVHDAIDDQRRRLELLQRIRLKDPAQPKIAGVRAVDLVERAVALAEVGS